MAARRYGSSHSEKVSTASYWTVSFKVDIPTSGAQRVKYKVTNAADSLYVYVLGYEDEL